MVYFQKKKLLYYVTPNPGKQTFLNTRNLQQYYSSPKGLSGKAGHTPTYAQIWSFYLQYWRNSPIKDIRNVTKMGLDRPILVTFIIMSLIGENLHISWWRSQILSKVVVLTMLCVTNPLKISNTLTNWQYWTQTIS